MENLVKGDKVKWIEPMMCVPHPEGKTDRKGVVQSVLVLLLTTSEVGMKHLLDQTAINLYLITYLLIMIKQLKEKT